MCSNSECLSFPHGRKAVVIAACVLSLVGTVLGSFTGGFLIGWLLAIFTSVVLVTTTCKSVNKGLLVAAGICGIIAALCQVGMSLLLSVMCGVVKKAADEIEGYNDAIKALGGDEDNYFIQAASNNSTLTEDAAHAGSLFSASSCGFLNMMAVFGYISCALLTVASILAFFIPPAGPATEAAEARTPEQPAPVGKASTTQ